MKKGILRICFVILLVSLLLTLTACSPARKLIGTWKYTESIGEYKIEMSYTFNKDGSGYLQTSFIGNGYFTYDVTDKNTIVITIDSPNTYKFSIDGDTLTLTGNGQQIKLIKQK